MRIVATLLVVMVPALAMAGGIVPAGGALTHGETNQDAFSRPAPSLDGAQLRAFNLGNRIFNTNWTVAPSSTEAFDGLGPTFNRVSCSGCHLRDGRGRPPIDGESAMNAMLVRWSIPGTDPHGAPRAVPGYGTQLNDRAIPGVAAEAAVSMTWKETTHRYADGSEYRLRHPRYAFTGAAYGALPKRLLVSGRVAPAVIGLGLLEAIPEAHLVAASDEKDRNGDGISGRVNRVSDPATGKTAVGRYGWKANTAGLKTQNAAAAQGDIGLSSSLFPAQNCDAGQTACARAVTGGTPELSDDFLDKLTTYTRTLGVPARRDGDDATVRRGEALFATLGCAGCHTPLQKTGPSDIPQLADQTFAPYTDLLLHDMGAGLADGRPDFLASGREWRTAPLWGIGLVETVNQHTLYLHDGRARNLAEAILWHDGEGRRARDGFRDANKDERDALLRFLRSL
ncbi:di-heme oxidoredictase family protein [Tahibacter amnicola]|uniref:C-type cytochrome n=1 Tax=Tahibacter amnicola TaxID=2976241 RepID=A0ABY6BRP3_9GAMM|nr:di-heme oxidoredictase family protein [Tahibacter amnicola]UXI70437.1 c-type cytochrome [Tahibacter amnicola]